MIGFGDADSFYASAEAVRRPHLAGLPVGVLGNQGACVIARSYPMKRYGVKVGEPIWDAKVKCPDGVYLKRDFRWYEELSRKMLAEVNAQWPKVEYYSIDEFFWQGEPDRGQDWTRAARSVRDRVKAAVGVPMTVAYARTRTLAKLFADSVKPFGSIAVIERDHERALLAKLPVNAVAGIGPRRAARLEPFGIRTCLDLADFSGPRVRKLLTATGFDIWLELNGHPATPIRPSRIPHKNIARGGSLAGRVTDADTAFGWLVRNVERLIEAMFYHLVRPRVLAVAVGYADAPPASGEVSLSVPADRFDLVLEAAKAGLRRAWRPGRAATHMHLVASRLVRPGAWQPSLFDPPNPKLDAVARLKRAVNEKFGRFKLRSAATLYANDFYQDSANEYEICDIQGKFCF
jgi:DNA polymerase V